MKIEWQSPGLGREKHTIPEQARIDFTLESGAKVSFQIKAFDDGTEYIERTLSEISPEFLDRRVGEPDRREEKK